MSHRSKLGDVWKVVKNMNNNGKSESIPALDSDTGFAKTNKEKADVFAKHYAKVSSTSNYPNEFKSHKEKFEREKKHLFERRKNDMSVFNVPFKLSEFKKALKKCKNTTPGKDMICYEMFKHMSSYGQNCVLKFFNRIWEKGFMPSAWKHALIIPILKPNKKKSDPASYRPIALTSNFCKLFERILVSRMNWYLEKNQLLSKFQSGFRTKRNTMDQLLRLSDDIIKNLANKSSVLGVFIDFEKAYDMIWTKGVLFKLHQLGIDGNMLNWINSFLHNRSIQVRVGTTLSDKLVVENGLPQGSVLSPILFLVAINDLVLSNVKHSLFADDVAIWKSGRNVDFIQKRIQEALDEVQTWCNTWGFRVSVAKSCFVLFKKGKSKPVQLSFNGQNMVEAKSVKFLGMIFDKSLTWNEHIKHVRERCQKRVNILKSLTGSNWGTDKETMVILYKTLVRSIIDYGCEIYHTAKESVLGKLDVVQSQCLRLICGAIKCTPVPALEVESGIPPLGLRREYILQKIAVKYAASVDNPAQECFEDHYQLYYGKYSGQFKPIRLKIQDAINKLPRVCPSLNVDTIPPWEYNQPFFDMSLHQEFDKKTDSPHFMKSRSLEHAENYSTSLHIFTDGSKCESRSGCGFYVPFLKVAKSIRLSDCTSVFIAEMVAILESLRFLLTKPPFSCVIFTDSLSAIQSLSSSVDTGPIHQEIRYCLYQLSCHGIPVTLTWIPSHVGIEGNEVADKLAKEALMHDTIDFSTPKLASDLYKVLEADLLNKWQILWDNNSKGRFYHKLQPEVSFSVKYSDSNRCKETTITRLRFGKCLLGDNLFILRKQANNLCEHCQVKEDVLHFLLHCSKYEDEMLERNEKILSAGRHITIEALLGDSKCYDYVWDYVVSTDKSL